jgi:repressor LexA
VLTQLETRILQCFRDHVQAHGRAPSLRELGEAMGLRSKGSLHRYVQSLVQKGFLASQGRGWHNLTLVEFEAEKPGGLRLPLLGRIAAGKPLEAVAGADELDLAELLGGSGRYVLKVQGDSMVDAGIFDGDWVIIQACDTARDGELVVALVDGEDVTLKRLRRGSNGTVSLIPENAAMAPMVYAAERVRIQGVLIARIRMF